MFEMGRPYSQESLGRHVLRAREKMTMGALQEGKALSVNLAVADKG